MFNEETIIPYDGYREETKVSIKYNKTSIVNLIFLGSLLVLHALLFYLIIPLKQVARGGTYFTYNFFAVFASSILPAILGFILIRYINELKDRFKIVVFTKILNFMYFLIIASSVFFIILSLYVGF